MPEIMYYGKQVPCVCTSTETYIHHHQYPWTYTVIALTTKLYDLEDGKEIRPKSRTETKSSFKNSHTSQLFKIRWLQTFPLKSALILPSVE
jgi:hypothetical protein